MFELLAHALCFGFAGCVAYIAKPNFTDPNYFTWHPTLMTTAFTFLAAEAVLTLSRNSLLGSSASRNSKVTGHLLLMLVAVACAVFGFLAVYTTKEQYQKPHLATPHAIIGFTTVCYILVQACAGMNLLFPNFVSKFINPRQLGRMHGLSGSFLLLLATLTLLGGVTTEWFQERVTGLPFIACAATPVVIYIVIAKQVWFKVKEERKPKKQS